MAAARKAVLNLIDRSQGMLKLRPEFVHRFYADFNRMGQRRLKTSPKQLIPERWIGSTVEAINPPPKPSGGLSMLADPRQPPMSLRDALRAAPREMLGADLAAAHGGEFRVLVKILDPGEAIVFHLHATDAHVRRMPRNFRGHRFGKDEAYYFLEAPKGPMPYTHAGLYDGVTRRDVIRAVERGPQHALELSPSLYQHYENGFFVPAGVPHRPGTALTLEIQQPSDVYTLLETHSGGVRMPPQQMHPGFRTLDEAFKLIDIDKSRTVGRHEPYRLVPRVESNTPGGQVATVFPPEVCRTFAGRRVRVTRTLTYREDSPLVLWVWRGRARINDRAAGKGDEFFVTRAAAAEGGLEIVNTGDELFEAFTFFPALSTR